MIRPPQPDHVVDRTKPRALRVATTSVQPRATYSLGVVLSAWALGLAVGFAVGVMLP